MIHIIYISRAVRPLSDQDLQGLLAQCRHDNEQQNVTGILFYSHGNIAQLIEGDQAILDPLFERISRDGRHSNVKKLISKPITARSFSEWSMAFHPLETSGFETLQGFLLPARITPPPSSLTIADAMLLDLVKLAVFGTEPVDTELPQQ